MPITKVSYRKLFNLGNYENETIGAEADVEPGQNAGNVMDDLRIFVEFQQSKGHEHERKFQDIDDKIYKGEHELASLQNKINAAISVWDKAQKFLKKHGIDIEDPDIPF